MVIKQNLCLQIAGKYSVFTIIFKKSQNKFFTTGFHYDRTQIPYSLLIVLEKASILLIVLEIKNKYKKERLH